MRFTTAGTLFIILTLSPFVAGQDWIELHLGVRAGVPFMVPFESRLSGPAGLFSRQVFSRPSVAFGPTFTAVVHDRIAIQFDAIYKRSTFNRASFNGTMWVTTPPRSLSSWEFPLIVDYSVLQGPIRPFGGGGILVSESISNGFSNQLPAYVINGGLEWRMSRLVIRPELRYTRWDSVSQATEVARRENQLEYLVGFSFRGLTP